MRHQYPMERIIQMKHDHLWVIFFQSDQVYELPGSEEEVEKISADIFDWDALDEACGFPLISMHEL